MNTSGTSLLLKAGLGLVVSAVTLGAGCWSTPQPIVVQPDVANQASDPQTEFVTDNITPVEGKINAVLTPDEVATAMVNEVDLLGQLFAVRPEIIQFNDHLDVTTADDAEFFLARHWWDEVSGTTAFENAITKYYSPATAATAIAELAEDKAEVTPTVELGDVQAIYFEPATAERSASLTYRYAVGQYGVRLTLFSTTDPEADQATVVDDLLGQLEAVAITQHNKLVDVVTAESVTVPTNVAIEHLPATLAGAEVLGTTTANFMEWFGTTYNLESEDFPGFTSAGVRRFQLTARPDEVVEITVIEFATATQATDFVAGLLPSLPEATEVGLPDSIAAIADAVNNGGLLEMQAARGRFAIDLTLFAPFGAIDETAATADLADLSATVVTEFTE